MFGIVIIIEYFVLHFTSLIVRFGLLLFGYLFFVCMVPPGTFLPARFDELRDFSLHLSGWHVFACTF
jgi:hypothetical protein